MIPCENCITLPVCKSLVFLHDKHAFYTNIFFKCSLIRDFLYIINFNCDYIQYDIRKKDIVEKFYSLEEFFSLKNKFAITIRMRN